MLNQGFLSNNFLRTDGSTNRNSFFIEQSELARSSKGYSMNDCTTTEEACIEFISNDVTLVLKKNLGSRVGAALWVTLNSTNDNASVGTCLELGDGVNWFGGPEVKYQIWPIERAQWNYTAYYPKEDEAVAIAEPYWVSSEGTYFYVNPKSSLFIGESPEPRNFAKDSDSRIEVAK